MNKVYAVIGDEGELYGIFSTEEKAEQFQIEIEDGCNCYVLEVDVDSKEFPL
jgi:hypothetical protein